MKSKKMRLAAMAIPLSKVAKKYKRKHPRSNKSGIDAAVKKFNEVVGGDMMMGEIKGVTCKQFVKSIAKTMKPGSARLYSGYLKSIFNFAIEKKYLSANPMPDVDNLIPKAYVDIVEAYSIEEIGRILNAECKNKTVKTIFVFSMFTGLRLSDDMELRWEHIHCVDGINSYIDKHQHKTGVAVRIPLCTITNMILDTLGRKKSGPVFNLPSQSTINRSISDLAENAGLKGRLTFHSSRHIYASLLHTCGTDIYTITRLIGHTNVKTTQRYTHIPNYKLQNEVENMAKLMPDTEEIKKNLF